MEKIMPNIAYFLLIFGVGILVLAIATSNFYADPDIPLWVRIGVVLLGVIMVCIGIFLNVRRNKAEHTRQSHESFS